MITYQEEDVDGFRNEVKPLLDAYYDALIVEHDLPFEPDYAAYVDAQERGHMVCISCRDDGKLVGLTCFFIQPYLYSHRYLIATEDLFYIDPEYRKGWAGIRMLKEAEKVLKSRGVGIINVVCKAHQDKTPLYERLGYGYTEKHFSKRV